MASVLSCCLLIVVICSVKAYRQEVLDFCKTVLKGASGESHVAGNCRCFGSQGKRGAMGAKGDKGAKGEKGDISNGTSVTIQLEKLQNKLEKIERIPEVALRYCTLGMKSGAIPDSSITSSTDHNAAHARKWARLDTPQAGSTSVGAWCPLTSTRGQWIQVDLGAPRLISATVIQGRPQSDGEGWWVATYKVACGVTEAHLPIIRERGEEKIFIGNSDQSTKVISWFPQPMTCRYVRLYPQTWHRFMCLRMDILQADCP